MDTKAPFPGYEAVTGIRGSGERAERSAGLIASSGVEHEFRTTYRPALLSQYALLTIAHALHSLGAQAYHLQAFRPRGCADRALNQSPQLPGKLPSGLVSELSALFPCFGLRNFDA